jgi:hypothetical protein
MKSTNKAMPDKTTWCVAVSALSAAFFFLPVVFPLDIDGQNSDQGSHRRRKRRRQNATLSIQPIVSPVGSARASEVLHMLAAHGVQRQALPSSSIAILIGRWSSWPGWTPFFLRTLGVNRWVHFHVLTDIAPASPHPSNMFVHRVSLPELLGVMKLLVGLNFTMGGADVSKRWKDVSAAKTNDLKPLWGEVFGDTLLKGCSSPRLEPQAGSHAN